MKKICIYILFLIFPCWLISDEQEKEKKEKIEISIVCGFGHNLTVKEVVVPVVVYLKNNTGEIYKGSVVVSPTGLMLGDTRHYEQSIILSGKSTKMLKFYMPLYPNSYGIKVIFNPEDAPQLVVNWQSNSKPDNFQMPQWIYWIDNIEKIKVHNKIKYLQIDTLTTTFPEHHMFLNNVFAMSIVDPRSFELNKEQKVALEQWLYNGGKLVFFNCVGLESLIKQIVPFVENIEFPTEGSSNDKHIFDGVTTNSFGSGRIICFYNPYYNRNVKQKLTNEAFLQQYFLNPKNVFELEDYYNYDTQTYTDQIMHERLVGDVDFDWMVLLLIGYLFCIGPVDYFITTKLKKRMLTWVIYIVSIVAFSFMAYAKGYLLKSGPMQLYSFNFIDVHNDNNVSGASIFGIYSTRNATYELKSKMASSVFLPLKEKSSHLESFFSISGTSTANVRIPIYSTKNYACFWKNRFDNTEVKTILDGNKTFQVNVPTNMKITEGKMFKNGAIFSIESRKNGISLGDFFVHGTPDRSPISPYNEKGYLISHSIADTKDYRKIGCIERKLSLSEQSGNPVNIIFLFCETNEDFVEITGESPESIKYNILRYVVPLETAK